MYIARFSNYSPGLSLIPSEAPRRSLQPGGFSFSSAFTCSSHSARPEKALMILEDQGCEGRARILTKQCSIRHLCSSSLCTCNSFLLPHLLFFFPLHPYVSQASDSSHSPKLRFFFLKKNSYDEIHEHVCIKDLGSDFDPLADKIPTRLTADLKI